MTIVLTVALTAIVIGVVTALVTARVVRTAITKSIGGRQSADPVDEHGRLLVAAKKETATASAHGDLLALALNALTSGVIITNAQGKVIVRNRLATQISSRGHEQTLIEAAASELLAKAVHGTPVEREVPIFGPPARILVVNAAPITSKSQTVGALAVIEDVTDHERIEKTRRDFVANLSHELRTPIGAVSLLAEMLVDEDDVATRAHLSERMLVEADRMSNTIEALLELSRIESDGETYTDVVVVQELLDDAVERTRVKAEADGVDVGAVARREITITGNRAQLTTALMNLVENAIKYSAPGDSVSVRARLEGDMVALIVQDTGRGIPSRDIDRIFERFYRVDRSRDASTGGTGIGLSIVRHVAINHGGTVSVESFEGEGSTFTMMLPIVAPQKPEPPVSDAGRETADEVG